MKKIPFFVVVLFSILLTACGSPQNLANMSLSVDEQKRSEYISWNDKTYYLFGGDAEGLKGEQIGIVDNNEEFKIFSVRGHSTNEWLIAHLDVGMGTAMLYKENNIKSIPSSLQYYKLEPEEHLNLCRQLIEENGRYIAGDNGFGWTFTLERGMQLTGYYKWLDIFADNHLGIKNQENFGNLIDVQLYHTLPVGMDSKNMEYPHKRILPYVFVFSNGELISYEQLAYNSQLEEQTVESVCGELSHGEAVKRIIKID